MEKGIAVVPGTSDEKFPITYSGDLARVILRFLDTDGKWPNLWFLSRSDISLDELIASAESIRGSKVSGKRAMAGGAGQIITPDTEEQHVKEMVDVEYPWTNAMRLRVDAEIKDQSTAEKLKAWYPGFCKRPTFHESYLSLFNRPNVTLVDTNGEGVDAYTPDGLLVNGREYQLDVLVLATGYAVGLVESCPSSALNAPLERRDNRPLKKKWDGEDYGTLYGAMTNGFPNLFFASGNGGSETLKRAENPDRAIVEVEKSAEDGWSAKIAERARWFAAFLNCTAYL
ncbi:hypothetical protein EDB81DRAFT_889543 [Dactylonectria macrodidyma]|uniref:FAD/NAD(P)-binding domain-containing protein n=1 Tax=Dactylonectria macrodidyma TaxID=307937 RepID=A0A9P9INR6_9HYPO|nr:hypothetical protein EDB81DRAFT_889543 [Dactylonectria macrodidyma]